MLKKKEILGKYEGALEISDDGELEIGYNATSDQIESFENAGVVNNATSLNDWEYYLSGTDIILFKYVGTSKDVVVPATYYVPVKDKYYDNNTAGIYNVNLHCRTVDQSTYATINYLFGNNNNIETITLRRGVEFWSNDCIAHDTSAFAPKCSSLKKVVGLPAGYYMEAFTYCVSLQELVMIEDDPEGNYNYISSGYAFQGIDRPVTVKVPNTSKLAGTSKDIPNSSTGVVNFVGY